MSSNVLAVAASGWALLMALSPLLQVRAIRRTGSSDGVSAGYFAVLVVGFALWVAYGASIGNAWLMVPNAAAGVIGVTTIVVVLRYRRRPIATAVARTVPDGRTASPNWPASVDDRSG